jgi:predicted alpha/beta hydrolase family esterase
MTKQILFIQGGGEGAHDQWDNKLVASLADTLGPLYEISYPRMPNEGDPSYAAWRAAISKAIAGLSDNPILVGHSVGATILVNALAENPFQKTFAGIFLIATPFIGPGGWPSDDIKPAQNLGARLPENTPIYFYHGSEDVTAPIGHVELYKQAVPQAHVRRLNGRDHQLNNDLSQVAAEILELA